MDMRDSRLTFADKDVGATNRRTSVLWCATKDIDPGWRSLLGGLVVEDDGDERMDRLQRTGCVICGETKSDMTSVPAIGDVCGEHDRALRQHYLLDSVEMRVGSVIVAALEKHRFSLDELLPGDAEVIDTHLRRWLDCVKEDAR